MSLKSLVLFLTISFISFAYSEAPSSHFALQCDKVQMNGKEYFPGSPDQPLEIVEEIDKGPFTFVYFDKEETKNGISWLSRKPSDGPFIWLQTIFFQDDINEAFLYEAFFNHKESSNYWHKFEVWNNNITMKFDLLSINRETLEVTMVTHDYKPESGGYIWTEYTDKFTSCRLLSAAEEQASLEETVEDWNAIMDKIEEKERLENEAAKAKQKI